MSESIDKKAEGIPAPDAPAAVPALAVSFRMRRQPDPEPVSDVEGTTLG